MMNNIALLGVEQAVQWFGLIAAFILLWHLYAFLRDNPKKFGLTLKRKAMTQKAERKRAVLRWAMGVVLVLSSYAFANTFLSVYSGPAPSETMSYVGSTVMSLLFISGVLITISSLWKPLRYAGDLFFAGGFVYALVEMIRATFMVEGNIYGFFADFAHFYLSLFGFLFIVLTLTFTVRALIAFDAEKMPSVKRALQQILQMGIGLGLLIVSAGIMTTISISFLPPQSFASFALDGDSIGFRYALILYLFGAFIYLRQIFPYLRYALMGLLSLSMAYFVYDVVNMLI